MAEEKKGFFSRLKEGLTKTRDNIVAGIDAVFYGASEIDDDFYEELEEILIMGDIGVNATNDIIERMKEEVKKKHLRHPFECKELLVESIKEQMRVGETAYDFEKEQSVIFIIGVNGVGKTTSVGKLAGILKKQGKKVLIAAADTFRAAAGDQLAEWAHRAGVDMIGGTDGADPASVIFDAVNAAKARNVDVLICDTAGRLHGSAAPHHRPGVSQRPQRKFDRAGRYNWAECTCTGERIWRGGKSHRRDSHQNGWYSKGRYRGSDTVRAECAGKIYRRR